jgi:hypothetical protein
LLLRVRAPLSLRDGCGPPFLYLRGRRLKNGGTAIRAGSADVSGLIHRAHPLAVVDLPYRRRCLQIFAHDSLALTRIPAIAFGLHALGLASRVYHEHEPHCHRRRNCSKLPCFHESPLRLAQIRNRSPFIRICQADHSLPAGMAQPPACRSR